MIGMQVESFFNGQRAVDEMQLEPGCVVLIDNNMPNLNGTEVGARIRAMPAGQSVCLVLLSGDLSKPIRDRAKEVGFDRVFHKPIKLTELIDFLRKQQRDDSAS